MYILDCGFGDGGFDICDCCESFVLASCGEVDNFGVVLGKLEDGFFPKSDVTCRGLVLC